MDELEKVRKKIDELDKKLVELIDKRARLAKQVYLIKQKRGLPVFDAAREAKKISWAQEQVKHFPKEAIKRIFVELFSGTRKIGRNIKVAYLGPEGSFSHIASLSIFGSSTEHIPYSLEEIFIKVQEKSVDYGVIPIENSRDGLVGESLDLLIEYNVKIIYEVSLKVSFCFFSNADDISQVKRLYSHQKAIAQCSRWIRDNLRNPEVIFTSSTSEGARRAYEDKEGGAIASEEILKFWNFNLVVKDVQDLPDERTDFAVISAETYSEDHFNEPKRHLNMRVSFCFSVIDKPGSLLKALYPIAKRKINMKKIHSRPDKITKRYNFFVEIEKPPSRKIVEETFEDIKKNTTFFKNFGEYPYRTI